MDIWLKNDSQSDMLNLTIKSDYTENNNSSSDTTHVTATVSASGVESLTVDSTARASQSYDAAQGHSADSVVNTLVLNDSALVSLKVTGDQALVFNTSSNQTHLTSIDASANTAGVTIDASQTSADAARLTIIGSATAQNSLTGSANADTLVGGSSCDIMTGNGGSDTFVFWNSASSSSSSSSSSQDSSSSSSSQASASCSTDTITDFVANTSSNSASLNGDVMQFSQNASGRGTYVSVMTSAADATTYLAKNAGSSFAAALDSSSHTLYVDNTGDGVADFTIQLAGVSTIDAHAFALVQSV